MLIGSIRRDPILSRESSMRPLTEPIALVSRAVLANLQPHRKLPLQPLNLRPWTDPIRTTPDCQQMGLPGSQARAGRGDLTVTDVELAR